MNLTDEELIGLVKENKESFKQIVEKYQNRIFNLVRIIVRNNEDAKEITQEVFVKAYLNLNTFKFKSSFYTWLSKIAYNMAIDFTRLLRKRVEHIDLAIVDVPAGNNPEKEYYSVELRKILNLSFSKLSEEHRAIVHLKEVENLSYEEIAKVAGTSVGTVMSRLFYARRKLQEDLEKEYKLVAGD